MVEKEVVCGGNSFCMMMAVINQLAWWWMKLIKLHLERKSPIKNTSNFAAHLKRFHKQAHESCMNKEEEKVIRTNQAVKRDSSGTVKPQTLGECLQRHYSKLYELAQDLLSAPASQAYVERIFSLCGFLTTG